MKMDRAAFSHQSFAEEEQRKVFFSASYSERLRVAAKLISMADGFVGKPFPKMDKAASQIRKRE